MKFKSTAFCLSIFAMIISVFSGCANVEDGVLQEVSVLSFPSGASVFINGEPIGATPLAVKLPRKLTHEVRLEKEGYRSEINYFSPTSNNNGSESIRYGLSADLGYYVDLEPRVMEVELQSDLVPMSIGADPFEKMTKQALEADRRLEAGEITPLQHKVIIQQIVDFFEANK